MNNSDYAYLKRLIGYDDIEIPLSSVKNAKYLAQICNKNVTSELLLLPFFSYPSDVSKILGIYGNY